MIESNKMKLSFTNFDRIYVVFILFCNNNNVTYFDSFGVKHISKEIKAFINNNKNITTSIFRIQAYDSMCGYFCIGFIDFMLAGKTLTKYTNLFSPNNFKNNDDVILNFL